MDIMNTFQNVMLFLLVCAVIYALVQEHKKGVKGNDLLKGLPEELKLDYETLLTKLRPELQALTVQGQNAWSSLHNKLDNYLNPKKVPMAAIGSTFADAWDIAVAWKASGDTNAVNLIGVDGKLSTPQSGTSPAYVFTAQADGGYKRTA